MAIKVFDAEYLPLREHELMIATSSYLPKYMEENNIKTITFKDLSKIY